MGSFLEGIFGINLIYDGLLKLTLMCVCARASMCARQQAIEDAKKAEKYQLVWKCMGWKKKSTFNQNSVHNSKFNFLQD